VSTFHKLKVGQSVDLVGAKDSLRSPLGKFAIVRLMPTKHGHYQHRIHSLLDGHERIVSKSKLEDQSSQ
jgi:hypothetical protein